LSYNYFFPQDLSFLTFYTNLKKLYLTNNRFTGSLDYLSEMKNLKILDIANNNINEVNFDKLPKSLEEIICYNDEKLDWELTEINLQLKRFEDYARCKKCLQPNTSKGWCQSCAEQRWKEDIKFLTGQKLVKKFNEQQIEKNNIKKQIKLNDAWFFDEEEQYCKLLWMPYEKFTDIEYLDEGGFSKIYRAKCKEIKKIKKYHKDVKEDIVLKSLNESRNITLEFLQEIANTKLVKNSVVSCIGISQEPSTKNYAMIMEYIKEGNLRQRLQQDSKVLNFVDKLEDLSHIASGLWSIHEQDLVHRDFHSGNILGGRIADLGLSQAVNYQKKEGKIFGVLPYVAPEVLQDEPYTKASDIYSFGIIAYEYLANSYPYVDSNLDDIDLALKICQGHRPNIDEVPLPHELKDLIKKCWDAEPQKRPNTIKLADTIGHNYHENSWVGQIRGKINTSFYQQYQVIENEYNVFSQNTPYQIHPTVITTSRSISTQEIARLFQESQEQALEQEIKKIEKEIDQPLTEELRELVKNFIQARKIMTKNESNKEAKDKALELEDQLLEEKDISQEKIDKIISYCKRLVVEQNELQTQIEISANK